MVVAFLSSLLSSCAPRSGLILVDPALAVLDPGAAKAYSTFRAGGIRWTVREYPARTGASVFEEFAARPPDFVLLTPLLASELQAVREAFPEARILGTSIPAGGRTVSAVWDPIPAAREAGSRAGAFLLARETDFPESPEAVILVYPGGGGSPQAAAAFREGLESVRPSTPVRLLELPDQDGKADSIVRGLDGSGAKAVFLDAGAAGFQIARDLRTRPSPSGPSPGPLFTVLRFPLAPLGEEEADLVLLRDTRILLGAFRSALEQGKNGSVSVQETIVSAARTK